MSQHRDPVMEYIRQFPFSYYSPGEDTIDTPKEFRLFTGLDKIHFNIPAGFPTSSYVVAVETLDTASAPWKSFSALKRCVDVPAVHLGPYARIALLPNSERLPAFYGMMHRGGTYGIPIVNRPGRFQLEDHNMLGPS